MTEATEAAKSTAAPDSLRNRVLDFAFHEMYEHGFTGLRIDALLAKAKATKGAFYHHFPSKTALGYAVVDEVLDAFVEDAWVRHLARYDDPVEGIAATALYAMQRMGPRCTEFGCPINNLAQEMSAIDAGFQTRVAALFARVVDSIADALRRGQRGGYIRRDIDPQVTALFTFAAIEGMIGLVKAMGADGHLDKAMAGLHAHLQGLRPQPPDRHES